LAAGAAAQAPKGQPAFPALEPDPRAVIYARMGEDGLDWEELAEMGLWASGADIDAQAGRGKPAYRAILAEAAAELRADPALPEDPKDRGDYILRYAHQRFLKRYSLNQTRLDTLLREGQFNCVSSAALYAILATACGLDAGAIATKDHAFITINVDGETIDVETTNPYGFDPGNKKEFHDDFGKVTGFAYTPARNYRDRTAISLVELVSLILSNRVTDLEGRGRYGEAVTLAVNRMALLAGAGDRADSEMFHSGPRMALDRMFNYAASLLKAGREETGLAWADYAEGSFPAPARWGEFRAACLNNLVVKGVKAKRPEEARAALARYGGDADAGTRRILESMIEDSALTAQANAIKSTPEADALLERLALPETEAAIGPARLGELRAFALGKKAELMMKAGEGREAVAMLEAAAARYPGDAALANSLKTARANRAASLHNQFAAAYNKRNYDEARELALRGLEEYPRNAQLKRDLALVDKALAGAGARGQ